MRFVTSDCMPITNQMSSFVTRSFAIQTPRKSTEVRTGFPDLQRLWSKHENGEPVCKQCRNSCCCTALRSHVLVINVLSFSPTSKPHLLPIISWNAGETARSGTSGCEGSASTTHCLQDFAARLA